MNIANYTLSILATNLSVLFSWGFCVPMPIENGQIFSVDGFKLKGNVAVKYNAANDLFDVEILTFENVAIEFINGVYFDQLIEVIDNRVELVDN